jgi:hypothetical protein
MPRPEVSWGSELRSSNSSSSSNSSFGTNRARARALSVPSLAGFACGIQSAVEHDYDYDSCRRKSSRTRMIGCEPGRITAILLINGRSGECGY